MKYICLAYEDEAILDALSSEEWAALREETLEYVEALTRSGHHQASAPLESVRTATTVRVRNGRLSATDGPYTETKETLGGFFIIEARDLNEAIQIAGRWPSARFGSIEVRPLADALRAESRYGAPS
ncbi:YciI family protein [Sinimarinibacterium sp. CAU 1509]|uniref:YciI family protein n=1 Tax=Sinimarinibacterium sp. CAU 1509 TaxID=2562283 RepID=UPI0010AD6DB4|nr:YciI family protein [Sinimarinibacterium sp. CAU 1509]TJY65278.1 YciI family protein [Sinimarinibacterium sp. CAU 1509]